MLMPKLDGGTTRGEPLPWCVKAVTNGFTSFLRCRLGERMEKLRGYDRRPTEEEALAPPDQRPWTEYDGRGDKQSLPPFKALGVGPCLCFGPTCCVFELQWPEWLCN